MRCLIGLAILIAAGAASSAGADRVRGVTLSTHTDGRDWAGDGIVPAMSQIRSLGAGWVAIHPYASVRNDGTVRSWALEGERPDWLDRPIREAHARGLKIFIKPHLAYWGSRFTWRGDIAFSTDEEWDRFWRTYREWIVDLAAATTDADGFAVGTELDRTLGFEPEWRYLVDRVREVTPSPLTYAANWSAYRQVPFWDAVDIIGIQAYFPISDRLEPDSLDLVRGWESRMRELDAYADSLGRHIVFTELGYNRSFDAPREPWSYRVDGTEAEPVQRLCLEIALASIEQEPTVVGAFLWKWFPEPHPVGRNFQLATPLLKRTISAVWRPAAGMEPQGGDR